MPDKKRLDVLVAGRGLCKSRSKAKREIMAGNVYVSGQLEDKPGERFSTDSEIDLKRRKGRYVSRGGKKLEKAIQAFQPDIEGSKVLDIGASTGGFTDCLLENNPKKIWALDVGKGQLDWELRQNDRVIPVEGKNARYLKPDDLDAPIDLITIDVSFISLELILPSAESVLSSKGEIIALVKPQFEAGPDRVESGGVVTDPQVHLDVLKDVYGSAKNESLVVSDCIYSPIRGKSEKNIEYFFYFTRLGNDILPSKLDNVVESAHDHFS